MSREIKNKVNLLGLAGGCPYSKSGKENPKDCVLHELRKGKNWKQLFQEVTAMPPEKRESLIQEHNDCARCHDLERNKKIHPFMG